ncbi:MAG: AI-2E family transporter [Beutenbergiaceae bacterium]
MGWFGRRRVQDAVIAEPVTVSDADSDDHRSTVTYPVRVASDWAWRSLVIVVASAALIYGLVQLETVVVPVLLATLLAALLAPLKDALIRRAHFPPVLAVLAVMFGAIGALVALLTLAGNAIVDGVPALWRRASFGFQNMLDWLSEGPLGLDDEALNGWLLQAQSQLSENIDSILSGALSFTSSAGHVGAGALITLFCLFFFLKEGQLVWTWLVGLFPRPARAKVDGAGMRAWISLGDYARTQIVVAIVDGIGIGLGAMILGVPLALPLAILVFIGAFIPIIGALISGSVAVAVALVAGGPLDAIIMLVIVLGVQQVEGHLLQPLLMSRALKLHPVAVLLSVTTGTIVGGIVGALFAVPLIATVNTAVKYLTGQDPLPKAQARIFNKITRRKWRKGRPGGKSGNGTGKSGNGTGKSGSGKGEKAPAGAGPTADAPASRSALERLAISPGTAWPYRP